MAVQAVATHSDGHGLLVTRLARHVPTKFQGTSGFVVALFTLTWMYPAYRFLKQLLWVDGHFTTSAFTDFVHTPGAANSLEDTAIVVGIAGAIAMVIGGGIAYLNERTDARMGPLTDVLPFLPFLIPSLAGAIGWVFLLDSTAGFANAATRHVLGLVGIHLQSGPFNIYSYPGLIFVYSIYMVPLAFLLISTGLRNMDHQLEEQSQICGAGPFRTLIRVVMPAIAPAIAGAALLILLGGFGMLSVPEIIAEPAGINILAVKIVTLLNYSYPPQYGPALSLSSILIVLVMVAWYLRTRMLRRARHSTVGGRGRVAPRLQLGVWKWPIRIAILLYAAIVTLLPAIALMLVILNGFWQSNIRWHHLSLRPFWDAIFDNSQTLLALKDSFTIGAAAATVGIAVATLASFLVIPSRRRLALVGDGTLKLPIIVPHLVLAIGFVLAYSGPPFHLAGTWMLLLIAYLTLYMPLGTLVTDSAASQVGSELREASVISGAGGWRTFRKVYLPLMLPGIAIGWALLFVRVLGDLEIAVFLAGPGNPTIGSQTLVLEGNGGYSGIAALAFVLVFATTIIVVGVFTIVRRRSRWAMADAIPTAATRAAK